MDCQFSHIIRVHSHGSLCSLAQMPTRKTLAKARDKAAEKAQTVSRLQEALRLLSPPSSSVDSSHSRLDFPDSETPMAPPSEAEEGVAPSAPRTRSRKRTVSDVSKSESSDIPVDKPAKKPGPKPRSKPLKAPKKKAAPKPTDGSNSESEISDVEPVVKPKSAYKNLCHSLAVDKCASEKKKKSAIEYDLDGVEVVPVIGIVFTFILSLIRQITLPRNCLHGPRGDFRWQSARCA